MGSVIVIEETALAIQALTAITRLKERRKVSVKPAIEKGFCWLANREVVLDKPYPIGLYFARLWYYELIYKLIFSLGALHKILIFQKEN